MFFSHSKIYLKSYYSVLFIKLSDLKIKKYIRFLIYIVVDLYFHFIFDEIIFILKLEN